MQVKKGENGTRLTQERWDWVNGSPKNMFARFVETSLVAQKCTIRGFVPTHANLEKGEWQEQMILN